MNYYDYRDYFRQITTDLDSVQTKQDDLQASIAEIRTEFGEKLDRIGDNIQGFGLMITVMLVAICALGVMFR